MVKKNKTFKEALNNWLKDEAKVQVLPSEVNDVKQLTDKEINYLSNKCELEFADRSFKIGDVKCNVFSIGIINFSKCLMFFSHLIL